MSIGIFKTLLLTVLIAFAGLFVATQVGAQPFGTECGDYAGTDYKSWTCRGDNVEIAPEFPKYGPCPTDPAKDCSTYEWIITAPGPSHFDILIPRDMEAKVVQACNGDPGICTWTAECDGRGDTSTDTFGKHLTFFCTGKFSWTSWSGSKTVSLTLEGRLSSYPTDSFLKRGNCGLICTGVDPASCVYVGRCDDDDDCDECSSCFESSGYSSFEATLACENSSWGPILGPAEPCEPVALGVTSSRECNILATLPVGTVYILVARGPDGCSVDEDASEYYFNSPDCTATADCATAENPAAGCKYIDPVNDCDANEDAPICIDPPEEGFQICSGRLAPGCPECVNVLSGSPTCVKYTTSSGTRIKSCFLDDGTTCSWKKCCKSPEDYPGESCNQ